MSCTVRPYEARDRDAVRHICCESGFMGEPVDPLFADRDLFADFFTAYYTDCEPAHCLVAEADGRVVGYLICCIDHARYPRWQAGLVLRSVPRVCGRVLTGRYRLQDLRFLCWFLLRAHRETPAADVARAGKRLRSLFATGRQGSSRGWIWPQQTRRR